MIKIAPSILAADPLNLERDVRIAETSGCDWIHVDIMDAHFVPNLAYSAETVRRLRETTALPLDVHLMMDHPESMLDAFLDASASCLTVHAEIGNQAASLLARIRARGRMAGIALRPASPLSMIRDLLPLSDLALMMTVEPGFGGQKLDEKVVEKIAALKNLGYTGEIEADGGIREDNLPLLVENGLTVAVMGTALFGRGDMAECVRRLHGINGKV